MNNKIIIAKKLVALAHQLVLSSDVSRKDEVGRKRVKAEGEDEDFFKPETVLTFTFPLGKSTIAYLLEQLNGMVYLIEETGGKRQWFASAPAFKHMDMDYPSTDTRVTPSEINGLLGELEKVQRGGTVTMTMPRSNFILLYSMLDHPYLYGYSNGETIISNSIRKAMNASKTDLMMLLAGQKLEEKPKRQMSKNVEIVRSGIKIKLTQLQWDDPKHHEMMKLIEKVVEEFAKRMQVVLPISARMPEITFHMQKKSVKRAGLYNGLGFSRSIEIFMDGVNTSDWRYLLLVLAHEYGHDVFNTFVKYEAIIDWSMLIIKDANYSGLLDTLENDPEILKLNQEWFKRRYSRGYGLNLYHWAKTNNHELWVQLDVLKDEERNALDLGQEAFLDLVRRKNKQWKMPDLPKPDNREYIRDMYMQYSGKGVPTSPITPYGKTNPEEAFCEAFGMYVAYGPKTVLPLIRSWLQYIMPMSNIVTSKTQTVPAADQTYHGEMTND